MAMPMQPPPPPQQDLKKQGLMKRLQGMVDSRGMLGQFSRGNNVYNSGSPQATMGGGPGFGPPVGNTNAAGPGALAPGGAGGPPASSPFQNLSQIASQAQSTLQATQLKNAAQQAGAKQNPAMRKAAIERRMNQNKNVGANASAIRDQSLRM